MDDLTKVREIVPVGKLAIGSGVDHANINQYENIADILIIGTSFKKDGNVENPVDIDTAKEVIDQLK